MIPNQTWIPLRDKRPVDRASWSQIDYVGVDPELWDGTGQVGIRLDHFVVIDCDNEDAMHAWRMHVGPLPSTYIRKTPRGWHFYYRRGADAYGIKLGPLVSVHSNIDVKASMGAYVVFYGGGYHDLTDFDMLQPFDPRWVPERTATGDYAGDVWSEMPDGIGDNAMTAFAGTFRRWGMDQDTIKSCLVEINRITMTEDPMPRSALLRIARSIAKHNPEDAKTVLCPSCGTEVETR